MSDDQPTLNYATSSAVAPHLSVLAVVALIFAIVVNPLSLKSVFGGPGRSIAPLFVFMALPLALALIATVRIVRSRKSLRGLPIAIIALVISLGWWGILALLGMAFAGQGHGRF